MIRILDSAGSTLVVWGRQQQHEHPEDAIYVSFRRIIIINGMQFDVFCLEKVPLTEKYGGILSSRKSSIYLLHFAENTSYSTK